MVAFNLAPALRQRVLAAVEGDLDHRWWFRLAVADYKVLERKGRAVAAAFQRIFGKMVADLPTEHVLWLAKFTRFLGHARTGLTGPGWTAALYRHAQWESRRSLSTNALGNNPFCEGNGSGAVVPWRSMLRRRVGLPAKRKTGRDMIRGHERVASTLALGITKGTNRFRQYWAELTWDVGSVSLTYIPAYRIWNQDADILVLGPSILRQEQMTPKDHFLTQEVRIASSPQSRLTWQAGLFYYDNDLDSRNTTTVDATGSLAFRALTQKATRAVCDGLLPAQRHGNLD